MERKWILLSLFAAVCIFVYNEYKQFNAHPTEQPRQEQFYNPPEQYYSEPEPLNDELQDDVPDEELSQKEQLLADHNNERKKHGASALQIDESLAEAAQKHAEWMAQHNNMTHRGFENRIPPGFSTAGENIAYGQRDAHEVVDDWMHSSGHRRNILNKDYDYVGFGVAKTKNGTIYWCTIFGGKHNWIGDKNLLNRRVVFFGKIRAKNGIISGCAIDEKNK